MIFRSLSCLPRRSVKRNLRSDAWHDGSSINLNYCWMLEQHMDLWVSSFIASRTRGPRWNFIFYFRLPCIFRVNSEALLVLLPALRCAMYRVICLWGKLKGLGTGWGLLDEHRALFCLLRRFMFAMSIGNCLIIKHRTLSFWRSWSQTASKGIGNNLCKWTADSSQHPLREVCKWNFHSLKVNK